MQISIGSLPVFAAFEKDAQVSVAIKGMPDAVLEKEFLAHSKTQLNQSKRTISEHFLESIVQEDIAIIEKILNVHGYFKNNVDYEIEREDNCILVNFKVLKTTPYKYGQISLDFQDVQTEDAEVVALIQKTLEKLSTQPAAADKLYEMQKQLIHEAGEKGYPFAKIKGHHAVLKENREEVDINVTIALGQKMYFGAIQVMGNENTKQSFIVNRAPWQEGDIFQRSLLDRYEERLYKTGNFEHIKVIKGAPQKDLQELDIEVTVKERKEKTIIAGIQYSLNDGAGIKLGWQHRNLTGNSDKIFPKLKLSQRDSTAEIDYTYMDFWGVDTSLVTTLEAKEERTKAYDGKSIEGAASLNTVVDDELTYYYGISFAQSRLNRNKLTTHHSIFGVPLGVRLDKSDDALDPHKGYKVSALLTPYVGDIGDNHFMVTTVLTASHYLPLHEDTTWAHWVRFGKILGSSNRDIPLDLRFYSGGGGSVRGYGFQLAGPVDVENDPVGGDLIFEGGSELRHKFSKDWGGVLFIEGAHLRTPKTVDAQDSVFYGTGLGLRYYTDIGVLRGDVAIPISEKRTLRGEKIDRPFQVYISIGQSF